MSNFKRKSALALAMMLTFVTVFGVLKPSVAKAWTNLTIASFDTVYEHNGAKQFGNMSRGILKRFLDKRVTLTNLCTP